jgi:hypothetical protein
MPKKRANLRPDVAETAFRVMQEAIGEAEKTLPPSERTQKEKNPEAVKRGARGGKRGGPARARVLSKARRARIAEAGAEARWKKRKDGL